MIGHALHHGLVAVGIYKAGEAVTYRRRAGWLVVAGAAVLACHSYHHGGSR